MYPTECFTSHVHSYYYSLLKLIVIFNDIFSKINVFDIIINIKTILTLSVCYFSNNTIKLVIYILSKEKKHLFAAFLFNRLKAIWNNESNIYILKR